MASNIVDTVPGTGAALVAKPLRDNFVAAKSEIENLQNTTAKLNNPARFGSAANYMDIDASGTIRLAGDATYFDDLIGGIAAAVTSGPGVSLSNVEHALEFVATANGSDDAAGGISIRTSVENGVAYLSAHSLGAR